MTAVAVGLVGSVLASLPVCLLLLEGLIKGATRRLGLSKDNSNKIPIAVRIMERVLHHFPLGQQSSPTAKGVQRQLEGKPLRRRCL